MGGGTYSLSFLQEIVTTLSTQNKAKVLVITDACHAGKLAGSQIGGAQLTSANLAKQYSNEVKILSCQPNEFSLEGEQWGGGRGVFSYHLVDGLFGLADKNSDAAVSVSEIDRYLEDHVIVETAPQSQIPIVLGNKTERLATVNLSVLADLQKYKSGQLAIFSPTEGRGLEDDVLAKLDSGIVKKYFSFKQALKEKRFFLPTDNCAEVFYASLSDTPRLAPLYGFMKRNYAASLQDGAQQVMNTMLKTGLTIDVLTGKNGQDLYRDYPGWLDRAAGLLGKEHYMYATLQARKSFFEGKIQSTKLDARKQFLKALEWQPDLPHAYVELISTCSAMEADSAELFAKKAMEIAPAWVVPYIRLALFNEIRLKNFEKSEALLNQATEVDSGSLLVWYQKANFYDRRNDVEKAQHWYLKAVESTDESICFPCAHLNLGYLYIKTMRLPEAEWQFNKALQLDSNFYRAYNGLGTIYRLTERFDEAERAYKKEIGAENEEGKAPTYNELGNLYWQTNRLKEAETTYKKSIQADSTFFNAYWNLALFYEETGRYAEGETFCKKMIQLDPAAGAGYMTLSDIYARGKRLIEAEYYGKKAVEVEPSGSSLYNYAWLLSLTNQTEKAFEALEQSLKIGYDYDWMQKDPDLAPLRELPKWKELMKKYFPDQVKD
jgi:tetratricopeptide (TPR) repeat protein